MYKLVPVLALIATVPISIDTLVAAELYSPGRLSGLSAVAIHGPDAAVVFVAGMGGGGTGGGMGGGMFGSPTQSYGGSASPADNAQPAYYTYQCTTPVGGCSFAAPAALRLTSLRTGARCACAVGQPEGQIR